MKQFLSISALAVLAGAVPAQRNEEPRTARPQPVANDVKTPAAPETSAITMPSERALRPSSAHATKPDRLPERVREVPRVHHDQLYFDVEADGTHWVRGRTYKASFGAAGATYIPFLGSRAPRNFPLALSLTSATSAGEPIALSQPTAALRDGDRITIDRGPIDEVYELALDSVEQTFVIEERPSGGDLRLVVAVESELARGESPDGFEFANEHGAVRYGRAFVREASGARVPVATCLVAGGLAIEVSAEYLSQATFPLVIDPVITTFAVNDGYMDDFEVDVSYDQSTDRYLVVYSETYSATDHDVFSDILTGAGAWIVGGYVDVSSEHWLGPKTANLNGAGQWLVAGSVTVAVPGFVIRGRTIEHSFAFNNKFNISTTEQGGEKFSVDVGGDPYAGAGEAHYCVVWRRNFNASDTDIHARLVRPDGTLVGTSTIMIDNSGATLDDWPSVSKSNGQLGTGAFWNITWHRWGVPGGGATSVRVAQLRWDGIVITPSFQLTSGSDRYASASSPRDDGSYMVTWLRDQGPDYDICGALLRGSIVEDFVNITTMDAPDEYQDQIEVSVDTDGDQFALVYAESYGGSTFDYDIFLTSLYTLYDHIGISEAHRSLDSSLQRDLRPEIISTYSSGGARRRYFAAWDETLDSSRDIRGGLYDGLAGGPQLWYCFGDGASGACPCMNSGWYGHGCANSANSAGAQLNSSGNADLSADTLQLLAYGMPPNVTCIFLQGTSTIPATAFGDGLRCAGGTLLRFATKNANASGDAFYPVGSEPPISTFVPASGAQREYQVYYRDSANFCTSATFNVTGAVRAVWLP